MFPLGIGLCLRAGCCPGLELGASLPSNAFCSRNRGVAVFLKDHSGPSNGQVKKPPGHSWPVLGLTEAPAPSTHWAAEPRPEKRHPQFLTYTGDHGQSEQRQEDGSNVWSMWRLSQQSPGGSNVGYRERRWQAAGPGYLPVRGVGKTRVARPHKPRVCGWLCRPGTDGIWSHRNLKLPECPGRAGAGAEPEAEQGRELAWG